MTAVLSRLRAWPSGGHDDGLRGVTARLAVQTVALLLIMLLALEIIVYLITQQALLGSLESNLKNRAHPPPDFVASVFTRGSGPFYPPPNQTGNGSSGQPGSSSGEPGSGSGQPGGAGQPGSQYGFGPPPVRGGPYIGHGPFGPNPDVTPSDVSSVFFDSHLVIRHVDGALGRVLLDDVDVRQALASGAPLCCSVQPYQGTDYLIYTAPLRLEGRVVGAVQNSISERQFEGTMQTLQSALLMVALLGLLISGGISIFMVRRALLPVRLAVQRQRDFVADAAHELRTPLAVQRTVGEVGFDAGSVEELQSTLAQMLGQNQHLTRLVDDLSLLARTDTGTVALDRSPLDLSTLVTDTAAELGYLAEDQGVGLDAQVEGQVQVVGDVLRLRQLLLILIDNALKHTPEGGSVTVRLSAHGGRARLDVVDTGPGIDPTHLPRIFERFYQADTSRTGKGSGLGLAIGKWIAEAHGGHITAGNVQPHGAIFTVTLPAARLPAPALSPAVPSA